MIHHRCQHCGHRLETVRVIVATVHGDTEQKVGAILSEGGLEVHRTAEGREIFSSLESLRPELVVLEKGLPRIFGFEIYELIKKSSRLKSVHVILIEQENDTERMEQLSLPSGVDAVLEEGKLEDLLLLRVADLLPDRFWVDEEVLNGDLPAALDVAGSTVEEGSSEVPLTQVSEEEILLREDARRLARTIISDIVLYNPEKVADGIQNGNFCELLKEDLEEGRRLFQERVPSGLPPEEDSYQAAIEDFLQRQGFKTSEGFPLR